MNGILVEDKPTVVAAVDYGDGRRGDTACYHQRMCAEWRTSFNRNLLAHRLEQMKEVDAEGNVSFRGLGLDSVVSMLESAVNFGVEMPEGRKRGYVYRAVFDAANGGMITAEALLRGISAGERDFESLPPRRYVHIVGLSMKYRDGMRGRRMEGTTFTFGRYLPLRFRQAHEEMRDAGEDQVFGPLPSWSVVNGYAPVRVSVCARAEDEAMDAAVDALDLLRGIWNLYVNRGIGMRSSAGRRKPVNRILLGPIHSLHEPSGALAAEHPWIERGYVGPLWPHLFTAAEYNGLVAFEEEVRRALTRCAYRAEAEEWLRRYVRALDLRDWNASFVRLWGLLEALTGTSKDRYEVTQKRVLFTSRNRRRDFDREILRHLTGYRNRTVHAGYETEAVEPILWQLKAFVERLIEFHLTFRPRFDSTKDATEFMDSPIDPLQLRVIAGRARRAAEYQSEG